MEKDKVQTICFVTMEIWPGTGGGIGRLISENSRLLSEKGGRPVFLLDVDDNARNSFMAYAERHIPGARVYTVNELLLRAEELQAFGPVDISNRAFRFYHYWRSYLIDLCLQYILTKEKITGIEFADYLGQGYVYFKMRPLRPQCLAIPAWLRLHGSVELWNEADGREKYTPGNLQIYDMERYCLSHSDYWVAPSEGVWSWYKQYYKLQKHCFISPPGFQRLGEGGEHPRCPVAGRPRRILFYGKLQHIKGPDLLIRAALKYLIHDDPRAEILLVGPDVPAAGGCSTRTQLQALIPEKYLPNFIFKGKIHPRELPQLAASCDLAVFPSRAETFCLAAHELNWIGIPLLVNNIPGLDFFNESNSLQFNGTVNDLYNKLRLFFKKPELTKNLKWQIPKDGVPIDRLYKELNAGKGDDLKPGLSGNEPPVDIFITGSTLSNKTVESINNMNYHNWQAWHLEDQVSAGVLVPVPGKRKIKPGRKILTGPPGGGCAIDKQNLVGQFCLFLPEWIRPRPDFLPLAVAVMMADPGLAGVTCFAAREKTLPGEEKYIIPYDLNPWLIFIENCTGAVPALWRRDVVEKLFPDGLVKADLSWSFYCSLAEEGEKVAVLPQVLMDVSESPLPPTVPPVQDFADFIKKNAVVLMRLWAQVLAETRFELQNANTKLSLRVDELELTRDDMWREIQRLTKAWEEQRSYIHGQEKTCNELWSQLQNTNLALQQSRAELKECRQTMDQLLAYLEEKKIIRLMTVSGLLDIKQFRREE